MTFEELVSAVLNNYTGVELSIAYVKFTICVTNTPVLTSESPS